MMRTVLKMFFFTMIACLLTSCGIMLNSAFNLYDGNDEHDILPAPVITGAYYSSSDSRIYLYWKSVSSATSYDVYGSFNNTFSSATNLGSVSTSSAYMDADLNTTYYFWVVAICDGTQSSPSNYARVITPSSNANAVSIYNGKGNQL